MIEIIHERDVDSLNTKTPGVSHTLSYELSRYLCGTERKDVTASLIWRKQVGCIVCEGLWAGMSDGERQDLQEFWRGR